MADERRTKFRQKTHLPNLKLHEHDMSKRSLSPVQNFLQRKEEVTKQDHEEFSAYVQEKAARDQQQTGRRTLAPARRRLNRRSVLKWAAGTAAVAEGAALGYSDAGWR